jgi:MFS family permease
VKPEKPRSVLGLVFLTVFLDIAGFSILFPLFPDLLAHYLAAEGEASALGRFVGWLREVSGGDALAVETLFGGVLGSVYALLQFLFAPVWGGLSDKIGRKSTLLFTLAGTCLAYVAWVFAGGFAVLVASRFLGGIMAGNISTASAAVADSTEGRQRAVGMGIVGMAIGLGFILGPAIGGITSQLEMAEIGVATATFAINPFSAPAIASLAIAVLNLGLVAARFQETLPPARRGEHTTTRTLHPFKRLRGIEAPGVRRTNLLYLVYFTVFSGMEFTLVFLAADRLDFDRLDLTWMFVFIGLVIALVQGGVVRRMVPKRGEKSMAIAGLGLTAPGIAVLGLAGTTFVLYVGLFFVSVGSALATPCLSGLVSRYTPADRQGLVLGVFRSMGALARALGPILGGLLYWRFGSTSPYLVGAVCLLVPIAMARGLPPLPAHDDAEGEGGGEAPEAVPEPGTG